MVNKASITERVLSEVGSGLTLASAKKALDVVLDEIRVSVVNGEKVSLGGFGIFVKKERKARNARNPKTGEAVKVPAGFKVKFSPSKDFKEAVNVKAV